MTNYLVIDANLTVKLFVPNPNQTHLEALITGWLDRDYVLCAPTLWLYEVTSAINKTVHFKHITPDHGQELLYLIQEFDIELMLPTVAQTQKAYLWTRTLNRAAAYDSFYMALAESLNCPLWTADKRLVNAVNQPWVRYAFDLLSDSG